jgi:hypothetical protein
MIAQKVWQCGSISPTTPDESIVAGMKNGERLDELVQHVKLPPVLADSPYR